MSMIEVPQLKETVLNLRKLLKRVNFENNIAYRELEAENFVLKDELTKLQLAYNVLDQNCAKFHQAIGYWAMMYGDEEQEAVEGGVSGKGRSCK